MKAKPQLSEPTSIKEPEAKDKKQKAKKSKAKKKPTKAELALTARSTDP